MPRRLVVCGELWDPRGRLGEQCVVAENGYIAALREEPVEADTVLDYRGREGLVLPGFVDLHVHLRGLGLSYKEDEYTGSLAAAAGGVTLVADMPNTVPRLDSVEALQAKLRALERSSVVDYAVYAAIPPSPEQVPRLAKLPRVAGFKVYPRDLEERWSSVRRALAMEKLLVIVHPELPEAEKPITSNEDSRRALRACHWEVAAVEEIASLEPRARIHITHATCPSTVAAAKKNGFTVDTTPTYLLLDPGNDCLHRVNPPIRGLAEKQRLLQQLLGGAIDALASDHAPHAPREKSGDPLLCPPGVPWLEHWPSAMYCLVASGALRIEEFLKLASLHPAQILGEKNHGLLEPGYRADMVVAREATSRAMANTYSRARLAPYTLRPIPECLEVIATIVAGAVVYPLGASSPPTS